MTNHDSPAGIAILLAALCVSCGGKYVPEPCGTAASTDSKKITLTDVTDVKISPDHLDIQAGQKGILNISGKGTHNNEDWSTGPMLCGVVFGKGLTPLGYAAGNAVYPVRSKFLIEATAVVECTEAGYLKRLDNGKDFEKEADIKVSFVVRKDPDPRIGQESNAVHLRCIGGDESKKNIDSKPICAYSMGASTETNGAFFATLLFASALIRRRRPARPRGQHETEP